MYFYLLVYSGIIASICFISHSGLKCTNLGYFLYNLRRRVGECLPEYCVALKIPAFVLWVGYISWFVEIVYLTSTANFSCNGL